MDNWVGVFTVLLGSYSASSGSPVPSPDSVTFSCSGVFSEDWLGALSLESISMHSISAEDSWTVTIWPVGSLLSCCTVMRHTSVSELLPVILLIGIAFPNFRASALVLVLVDRRHGTVTFDLVLSFVSWGGVFFRSSFFWLVACVLMVSSLE